MAVDAELVRALTPAAVLLLAASAAIYALYHDRNARIQEAREDRDARIADMRERLDDMREQNAYWRAAVQLNEVAREKQAEGTQEALRALRAELAQMNGGQS